MSPVQTSHETLLLKQPTLSASHVSFVYAGDVWITDLDGQHPRRLTAQKGRKLNPMFSPDGQSVAFSGNYDGNLSVYVLPISGGSPQRLTYHPSEDFVRGWTPDGTQIVFASARESISARARRLYTVPMDGGLATPLPMPMAERAAFSPDGRQLAYTPYYEAYWSWKRYRGGMTVPIWVLDLDTYAHVEIPHENASDTFPCWLGDAIYFLSDRTGSMNLFHYDLGTQAITQRTFHADFDVRSLTSGAGRLAYEQGGRLHVFDPDAGRTRTLSIAIAADLPYTRPHYQKAAPYIETCGLSPTGARAVLEARGEILTVPAAKGDIRNLTAPPGVCARDPAWAPDGQSIAYFSDASGEYELVVSDQKGIQKRSYALGKPSFFHAPVWSPDSTRIAYTDKALNLSYITLEAGSIVQVDTDSYDHPVRSLTPAWSPDGRWLVYTKRLANHLRAVFLFELSSGQIHQVSDGMSDAISACFSMDGRLLYFAASVNFGLNTGWLDMSSYERLVNRNLYVAVLRNDDPSPIAPESDEETRSDEHAPTSNGPADSAGEPPDIRLTKPPAAQPAAPVQIDLDGLGQRIVALPVPPGDYHRLQIAKGKLFYLKSAPERWVEPESVPSANVLFAYDTKARASDVFVEKVRDYWVSADGRKLLYQAGDPPTYAIVAVDTPPKPEDGRLDLEAAEILVDPKAEWQQIFQEVYWSDTCCTLPLVALYSGSLPTRRTEHLMAPKRIHFPMTTASQRRLLFETWDATGDVALACRTAHMGRATFYYWKPRFSAGGYAALESFASRAPRRTRRVDPAIAQQVSALHYDHPDWGKVRIADELTKANGWVPLASPNTVRRILRDAGVWDAPTAAAKKGALHPFVEPPTPRDRP
jgi:tricorn protease